MNRELRKTNLKLQSENFEQIKNHVLKKTQNIFMYSIAHNIWQLMFLDGTRLIAYLINFNVAIDEDGSIVYSYYCGL